MLIILKFLRRRIFDWLVKKTHGHQFLTDTPFANKFEEYSIY